MPYPCSARLLGSFPASLQEITIIAAPELPHIGGTAYGGAAGASQGLQQVGLVWL